MKVIFFWGGPHNMDPQLGNPYARLLGDALATYGVRMEVPPSLNLWQFILPRRARVLHFNWLAPHYAGNGRWHATLRRSLSFAAALVLARLCGYRIVWTMHNLYPHEMPYPWVDRLIRLLMCRLAHAVIVHCQYAAALLSQHFGRGHGVHVIPHGHFIDPYPNTVSREEARRFLGLAPEHFVYLFVGNIRPYKGVEALLDTFTSLDNPDARLVIAGKLHASYQGMMPGSAHQDPRVVLKLHPSAGGIPADEMQLYLNAADVVVLPFVDTLTSGSAIMALGFGRPVIAPAVGCLTELLRGESCGIVYQPGANQALKHALLLARTLDLPAASQRARQRAQGLGWDQIAQLTLSAYGGAAP